MGHVAIGQRVRAAMPEDMTQRELATRLAIAPDALSRSLNGERGFSSVELAEAAHVLGADVHFLITGVPDPHMLTVAARHDYNVATGERAVPGRDGDEDTLRNVELAYRQAYPEPVLRSQELPGDAPSVRRKLGGDFVRAFADCTEAMLGVDVIRVPGLSTDYSLTVGRKQIVLLNAQPNWFRSNWSLAQELGHLGLQHHAAHGTSDQNEAAANAFAAELLLPGAVVRTTDWTSITAHQLALFVWQAGVSTDALKNRLGFLRVPVSTSVAELLALKTHTLLRRHGGDLGEPSSRQGWSAVIGDPITERMDGAAGRRFPLTLQKAHLERIAQGRVNPATLAWMLGSGVEDLPVSAPEPDEVTTDDLAAALGL